MTDSIGIAVIGAGMAGQAHAAAYRVAHTSELQSHQLSRMPSSA